MAAPGGGHVYATLLLSDSYLPGALVLAHSLRDAGTHIKLAVLVTLDSVSAESIAQLRTVYDYIFPVPRIRNDRPANLYLMDRADLHSAFTKINLWKLTEFSKIVYIDADVVAYRAPDELFAIAEHFAAAPDIGWPDLFNTGVMVLTPNMGDFYAMMAMAERGISFDGADQGLINMHFGSRYHRLSFTYNVTPSAHYQYVPAYRHFQSSINMVHFIGSNKPWFTGRDASHGGGPFDEMIGRWWAVYDRHYRVKESAPEKAPPTSEYVLVSIETRVMSTWRPQQATIPHPKATVNLGTNIMNTAMNTAMDMTMDTTVSTTMGMTMDTSMYMITVPTALSTMSIMTSIMTPIMMMEPSESVSHATGTQAEARSEQQVPDHHHHHHHLPHAGGGPPRAEHKTEPVRILTHSWDAQRQPPPSDSKPEALNFPSTHYEMSEDMTPFVPPDRYPSPPRNMWYEVPKERPAPRSQAPSQIFPWEQNRAPPTRTFVGEPPEPPVEETPSWGEPLEDSSVLGSTTSDAKSEPSTPATPTIKAPSDPWTAFTRVNAWDEVPEIERYVEGLQGHRRGKSSGSSGRPGGIKGLGTGDKGSFRLGGHKLTDFPSELDRPSLPVTPAPVRRPSYWSGGDTGAGVGEEPRQLPEAKGVPAQSEWDPMEQLQKLAKQQSDALRQKFGGSKGKEGREGEAEGVSREIPSRPLPFGSGDVKSPTYVAQSVTGVLSPQPVKGKATTSILRSMGSDSFDPVTTAKPPSIPKPSYSGPGAAWEKDEVIPERETPLLPTEEERDVLDT
ncbi:glycogenin glucosyltransferase [Neonectria magnoliae]|uniref:Glycogenin glucosyltransferase n=1 Tax=Neonectria magnoliae TaxID=2732573 RepID=A0ABR1HW39_9HYPO